MKYAKLTPIERLRVYIDTLSTYQEHIKEYDRNAHKTRIGICYCLSDALINIKRLSDNCSLGYYSKFVDEYLPEFYKEKKKT